MTTAFRLLGAGVMGLVLGMGALLALQRPSMAPTRSGEGARAVIADGSTVPPLKAAPAPEPTEQLLLVWTSGGLPEGLAGRIATLPRVERSTLVQGGMAELVASYDADGQQADELPDGHVLPLDTISVDPATYRDFVSSSAQSAIAALQQGEALLGATSARLRGVGAGGTLMLSDEVDLRVVGVIDDAAAGGAEVVVPTGTLAAASTNRSILVTYPGERAAIEDAIRALEPGVAMRLRAASESPYLRHGDAVLPQAVIKERFGAFAYRRTGGREVIQDPGWVAEHIVEVDLPILGTVRCHRAIMPALEAALTDLAERSLGYLLDADSFGGCHDPRLTSPPESLSRHAWGVAFDLNAPKNPVGHASAQDPRLVEVFERWGFAWGGEWLVPDPAHFEYVRAPI